MKRIAVIGCRPPKHPTTPEQRELYFNIVVNVGAFFDLEITLMRDKEPIVIVSGGAVGVDTAAAAHAARMGLETRIYRPEYPKGHDYPCGCLDCRRAPLIRNKLIVENCDELHAWIAPWSRGTVAAIGMARVLKKPVVAHDFRDDVGWPHRKGA